MCNDFFQEIMQNACPSIRMRAKQEIFNKKLTNYERNNYEKFILQGETIKAVLSWQMPDGYFGTRLHTPPSKSKVWSHEGCVRYLLEKGFSTKFQLVIPC
jgi:hypothetical protein